MNYLNHITVLNLDEKTDKMMVSTGTLVTTKPLGKLCEEEYDAVVKSMVNTYGEDAVLLNLFTIGKTRRNE